MKEFDVEIVKCYPGALGQVKPDFFINPSKPEVGFEQLADQLQNDPDAFATNFANMPDDMQLAFQLYMENKSSVGQTDGPGAAGGPGAASGKEATGNTEGTQSSPNAGETGSTEGSPNANGAGSPEAEGLENAPTYAEMLDMAKNDPGSFAKTFNNMNPGQRMEMQAQMQEHNQMTSMMSSLMKADHDTKKSIISNMRV